MLMCVRHRHFTKRNLILGLGRVQKSENVWICGSKYENLILDHAKNAYGSYDDLTRAAATVPALVDEGGDMTIASADSSPRADEVVFSDDEDENWSMVPAAFNFDDDDDA